MFTFKTRILLILFFLGFLVYSNSFLATWHFDDFPNIVNNSKIHLNKISFSSVKNTFYASPSDHKNDNFYRPVSMFSFAINWYFGQDNVIGYHLFNIVLHILNSFILFFIIYYLFFSPGLKNLGNSKRMAYNTALLTAVLWLLMPIHVQSVTYIVQRMAQMAAFFYLLSILFYIKGRLFEEVKKRYFSFFFSFVFYIFSIFSKENAIVLPLALLLIELSFFKSKIHFKKLPLIIIPAFLLMLFIVVFIFYDGNIPNFFSGYGTRYFSLKERLLTESRVIFFYINQILLPSADKFSILHDISLSKSLFEPFTTFFSLLSIAIIISFCLVFFNRFKLVSFSILFFLINHIVESTIIPLELIYEHRNYIPSFFLFLPIVYYFLKINNYIFSIDKIRGGIFSLLVLIVVCWFGLITYKTNIKWESEESLWAHAAVTGGSYSRPYINLSNVYINKGDFKTAFILNKKALNLIEYKKGSAKENIYTNLIFCFLQFGDYIKGINLAEKKLNIFPDSKRMRWNYILCLYNERMYDKALKEIEVLTENGYFGSDYFNLKTKILMKLKKHDPAYRSALKSLKHYPENKRSLKYFGFANKNSSNFTKSNFYLEKTLTASSKENILVYLCLIDNAIKMGDKNLIAFYINSFFQEFNLAYMIESLHVLQNDKLPLVDISNKDVLKESYNFLRYYINVLEKSI
ncbi:MAG: tetratricopeptide repeat protein [Candidatus Muiribacteriota bacterium]